MWEAEASKSRIALEKASEEVDAIKADLNDVRYKLLLEFLDSKFIPLKLLYTIKLDTIIGNTLISVIPEIGGELEFDKFKLVLNWEDTDNIPLFYIFSYFSEGLPWSS